MKPLEVLLQMVLIAKADFNSSLSKLSGIATEGTPSMVASKGLKMSVC